MKELTAKAAQIGQAAALKKANDPTLSDRAAKMAATLDAGYRDSWLDNNDDLVQGGYQKAMTTIRIQSWPGNKYWGWFFTWPWGVLSWLLIIVLLFAAFAPRPSYGPISSLSSLNSNMAAISGSLARIEALAPQIEAMDQRSIEGMQAIEELKLFTQRVEKTKLFRKSAGKAWIPFSQN